MKSGSLKENRRTRARSELRRPRHTAVTPRKCVTPAGRNPPEWSGRDPQWRTVTNQAEWSTQDECLRGGIDEEEELLDDGILDEDGDENMTGGRPQSTSESFNQGGATQERTPGGFKTSSAKKKLPRKNLTPSSGRKNWCPFSEGEDDGNKCADPVAEIVKNQRQTLAQRQRRDREKRLKEAREGSVREEEEEADDPAPEGTQAAGTTVQRGTQPTISSMLPPLLPQPTAGKGGAETSSSLSRDHNRLDSVIRAEIAAIADVVSHKCAGAGGDFFGGDESGVKEYDMEFFSDGDEEDDEPAADLDKTVMIEVARLVREDIRPEQGAQIKAKEVIPFVVLKFNPLTDKHWTVPDPGVFHDLINRVAGEMMEEDMECEKIYQWANLWGKVGLVGLSPWDTGLIDQFRKLLESQLLGDTRFTIFPKDALEKKGTISVLLRSQFRCFKAEWLPRAIIKRTKNLRGGLRLTHVKTYADSDKSRAGASKKGWRLALLQGCPRFMASLEQFPQDHRFPVGSGHVVIWGGSGRPKGQQQDPRPGQGQRRQGVQDRGRGRGRGSTMSGGPGTGGSSVPGRSSAPSQSQDNGRNTNNQGPPAKTGYDRSFPPGGLSARGWGGVADSGTWSSPGSTGKGTTN